MSVCRRTRPRWGRLCHEYSVMLALVLVLCVTAVCWLTPGHADKRPVWDRVLTAAWGLLQCFGLFVGASLVLASLEFAKQTVARYRQRRVERKLARLRPLLRGADGQATDDTLRRVVRLLGDGDAGVRQHALAATYCLRRANPALVAPAYLHRGAIERALLVEPGFARTLAEAPAGARALDYVTLGAKVGAGTVEKRIAPVTSDPRELARWVARHTDPGKHQELQVSVGYDTGALPFLAERGKFIALYLFLVSTDLKRFQALTRRPARDPNAAFGLLIRGDVVEVRHPGQARGRRLDYVFPLPARLTTANLAEFLRGLQLLNFGLLVASAEDACRALLPGAPPPWLPPRLRAAARAYREFERGLVALLRRHDRHRNPARVHPLDPADHAERTRAFRHYRLEECLYPQYGWVVPLYGVDTRWDRLLPPLRAVEGMLLHQGSVRGKAVTRGLDFIHRARLLGYRAALALGEALAAPEAAEPGPPLPPDPFLDPRDEAATTDYLRRVSGALAAGEAAVEDLPDPATFRQAAAYYRVGRAGAVA